MAAYVATTVSIDDKRFVEMLGADEVVVDFMTYFRDFLYDYDYDAVFDTIGGETYAKSFQGGIIVSMLEQPNAGLWNAMIRRLYHNLHKLIAND